MSPEIVNECIFLMRNCVVRHISKSIDDANFFAMMVDETRDVGKHGLYGMSGIMGNRCICRIVNRPTAFVYSSTVASSADYAAHQIFTY